jgi:hypothetical protein
MARRMDGIAAAGTASARRSARAGAAWPARAACGLVAAAVIFAGCSSRESGRERGAAGESPTGAAAPTAAPAAKISPAPAPADDAPLGVADLAALAWRERDGKEAFRLARAAERRGDWATMVTHCEAALAADPSHLEASWLLAAGLSHLKRFPELAAPLAVAVAGDPAKWAQPALQLSLFAPYWASGQGEALRPWIAAVQARMATALARSLIFVQAGRLLAYDRAGRRWQPLTRRLALAGAMVSRPRVIFVARGEISAAAKAKAAKLAKAAAANTAAGAAAGADRPESTPVKPGAKDRNKLAAGARRAGAAAGAQPKASAQVQAQAPVQAAKPWLLGFVDLRSGAVVEVQLPEAQRYEIVELAGAERTASSASSAWAPLPPLLVRADAGPWLAVTAEGALLPSAVPPPAAPRVGLPRLLVADGRAQLVRQPLAGIVADWDQSTMASALRIRRSNRLIAPPTPALIDGQRVQWSPAGSRLALVASLETCEPDQPAALPRRTLAYVVDPITGSSREVAQSAAGLELEWAGEQLLAIATDHGVDLVDLAAGTTEILGADLALLLPLRRTRCAVPPESDPAESEPAEPEPAEPEPAEPEPAEPEPAEPGPTSLDDL